jgi:SAM-dependent methyltransferase
MRKAREMGVEGVAWLQGDILAAANLERRFDVIECSGVLHHMRDPVEGWRVLLGLLKPDGFMKLGLYSEIARQHIVAARREIAARTEGSLEARIRGYRHEVFARADDLLRRRLVSSKDFYALSSCRDLLCHVQEHRFTLPQIETILDDLGLEFVGFERSDKATFDRYRKRFPEDPNRTRLDLWHQFEQDRPDTFRGMYQFWVRRRRAAAA